MDNSMGIPSSGDLRGQRDAVGFASTAEAMGAVWELSEAGPEPEGFSELPPPPARPPIGVLSPHDDYLYAGRVYRRLLPAIVAKTVVIVGVLHKYRAFAAEFEGREAPLIYDPRRAWRSPDGELALSPLGKEALASLPTGEALASAEMEDAEHSVEAVAYWLRHSRPDLEILPLLVPKAPFPRLELLARELGAALSREMELRSLALGRDLVVLVSSDAVHYGADFGYAPFGPGGEAALAEARRVDRGLLSGPLSGPIGRGSALAFFEACVDPERLDAYRHTWCGRFALPFGLLLMAELAARAGREPPLGRALAYATTIDAPELPGRAFGLGTTAPANSSHFVGLPAALYY